MTKRGLHLINHELGIYRAAFFNSYLRRPSTTNLVAYLKNENQVVVFNTKERKFLIIVSKENIIERISKYLINSQDIKTLLDKLVSKNIIHLRTTYSLLEFSKLDLENPDNKILIEMANYRF